MRALLDVNVLIALLDPNHERHEIACRWLEENIQQGWANCAITQNGCLRIMSQPAYPHTLPVALVADLLQEATDTTHHQFWPDASLMTPGVIDWHHVRGPSSGIGRGRGFACFADQDLLFRLGQSTCTTTATA